MSSFLGCNRKTEVSKMFDTTTTFIHSPTELGRRVGMPRIQPKDVIILLLIRLACHIGLAHRICIINGSKVH